MHLRVPKTVSQVLLWSYSCAENYDQPLTWFCDLKSSVLVLDQLFQWMTISRRADILGNALVTASLPIPPNLPRVALLLPFFL